MDKDTLQQSVYNQALSDYSFILQSSAESNNTFFWNYYPLLNKKVGVVFVKQ